VKTTAKPWAKVDAAGVGVCVALTVAAWLGALRPMLNRYGRYVEQQQEVAALKEQAGRESAQLKGVQKRLADTQRHLERTPLHLQPARMVNNRLAALTELAARSGVKLEDVQPGKSVRGKRYETVPIRLAGAGSYQACVRFLHQMRDSMPDTGVSAVQLTGTPGDALGGKFMFDVEWYAAVAGDVAAAN
jgi:Tfp pilus assembly protein PilO